MSVINPLVHAFACGDIKLGHSMLSMGADPNLPCPTLGVSLTRYLWKQRQMEPPQLAFAHGGRLDDRDLADLLQQYRYADDDQVKQLYNILQTHKDFFDLQGFVEPDHYAPNKDEKWHFWGHVEKNLDEHIRHLFIRKYDGVEQDKMMLDLLLAPPYSKFTLTEMPPYPGAFLKDHQYYPWMTPFLKLVVSFFNEPLHENGCDYIPHNTPAGDKQLRLASTNDYYYENYFKFKILLKHCLKTPGFLEVFDKALTEYSKKTDNTTKFQEYYERLKLEIFSEKIMLPKVKTKKASL